MTPRLSVMMAVSGCRANICSTALYTGSQPRLHRASCMYAAPRSPRWRCCFNLLQSVSQSVDCRSLLIITPDLSKGGVCANSTSTPPPTMCYCHASIDVLNVLPLHPRAFFLASLHVTLAISRLFLCECHGPLHARGSND